MNRKTEQAMREVGEYIRTWRLLQGLKASQVADRARISLSTYSKIEQGDKSVGLSAFLEVIRSLGLLENFTRSLDPYETDMGRARADELLPKRVR
ncbi:MAG: helix-turn-helix domain-containing protein [Clostridiales Family XIII bacterium]|nr:helix-turn-helix domain-containing protein [Clostridiales Family XIII bacterium]